MNKLNVLGRQLYGRLVLVPESGKATDDTEDLIESRERGSAAVGQVL